VDISEFWFQVDSNLVAVLLAIAILVVAEFGFRLGDLLHRKRHIESDAAFNVVEGGVLGLVALILGFSFSLAVNRFDARQHTVVVEANAIGTTYFRSSFLEMPDRETFRSLIRRYTRVRLDRYERFAVPAVRAHTAAETAALQNKLWRIVASEANRRPRITASLLAQATNDMFDIGAEHDASLANHVPGAIILLVIIGGLAGAGVIGFGFGLSSSSHWPVSVLYGLIIMLLVTTTLDLDRPSRGWIRVRLVPLSDQLRLISERDAAPEAFAFMGALRVSRPGTVIGS
jgi:hypothetical protein